MEALLEMQQSFADSKISSSVQIKKKSLFAQRSEKLKVVPSVITSKSNLFDGVLSEVVEKENMEFKDSRITFQKHGFPTASHRGSNVSKVEVQQSPKAAKKPVPANYPELEKLKWITDGPAPALADKLGLRFNFSGEILQSSAENLENTGMFHHGDEYSRPGYTLAEFSHLSKSTFPAQRVVALKSLTCIIRKLYDGNYKDLSALISKTCSELNLLLSARIGMDSHHSTVVDHSIDFIAAYIGCSGPYLELYDTLMNTITGKRILAVEKNSLSAFTEAPIKSDEEIDASIAGIMHSLYSDPLLGLLMTQIIVRIRFLLVDELASIERKLQLVAILSKLSTHSVSSCEDIMSCDGLIDILHSEIFQIAWPPPEQSIKTDYLCALLRLIRLLCLSSREATLALNKLRIFQSLMRFISIFSSDTRPIFAVQFQIFSLLNVCLSYGVCASILDEYHFILFENGKFLLDSIQKSVHNHSEHSFNTMTAAVVSWISLLNDALLLFRNSLNPGGKDDAFLPFLNIAAEILNQSNGRATEISSATLRFVTTHLILSDHQTASDVKSDSFKSFVLEIQPKLFAAAPKMAIPTRVDCLFIECGTGILQKSRLNYAIELCSLSTRFDYYSSLCQVLNFCCRKKLVSEEEFNVLLERAGFLEVVGLALNFFPDGKDWISSFGHGMIYFLNDYLSLCEIAVSLYGSQIVSKSQIARISWFMINLLLPGDEWIFQQCLKRLKLHQNSFLKTFFTNDILTLSKSFYLPSPASPPPLAFMMDSKSATILPLREFWCYDFPVTIRDASASCSLADLLSWLNFIEIVSSSQSRYFKSYHLYSLCNIFLLKDDVGDFHFLEASVASLGQRIIGRIACSHNNLLEYHRLYPLYLELLDNYQAVSYGDIVFGKCLLLFCQTRFPIDFRIAFWSKMLLYLNHFKFDCNEVFGNIHDYIDRKEENKQVLIQKMIAKKSGKVIESNTSAIWLILESARL